MIKLYTTRFSGEVSTLFPMIIKGKDSTSSMLTYERKKSLHIVTFKKVSILVTSKTSNIRKQSYI